MVPETVTTRLKIGDDFVEAHLTLFEETQENPDYVAIDLRTDNRLVQSQGENFFDALLRLRRDLEKDNIQICCNGAAEKVYPSPMQQSMGVGRVAYVQHLGQPAKETVDIFEDSGNNKFVKIVEQFAYHQAWLRSVTKSS